MDSQGKRQEAGTAGREARRPGCLAQAQGAQPGSRKQLLCTKNSWVGKCVLILQASFPCHFIVSH